MPSVNKVVLIGALGRDPDISVKSEMTICKLSVATFRFYKEANGQTQEETEWHRVALFGKRAETAGEYLKKGSRVYVEGHLRTRKYTDKQGVERYVTEVICDLLQFLDKKSESVDAEQPRRHRASAPAPDTEDVPF